MKICNQCKQEKLFSEFHKNKNHKDGYMGSCTECRQGAYQARKKNSPLNVYFIAKRSECKQKGIPFDLTEQYLIDIWTAKCPIFGTEMKIGVGGRGDGYLSHLDRIDPYKGYVQGNVAWISGRANRIKYNATVRELRLIADWLERATTIP